MLTLFTTPVVYLYLDRLQNWLSGGKTHQDEAPEAIAPEALPLAAE
jgi:HAE1 family hydrophobic/amphiphilic exporter-1